MISADSSYFVSLYLVDQHSKNAWFRTYSNPTVWITPLSRAEVAHAVFAHVFLEEDQSASSGEGDEEFRAKLCERGLASYGNAPRCLRIAALTWHVDTDQRSGIRTIDSLHIACALELRGGEVLDLRRAPGQTGKGRWPRHGTLVFALVRARSLRRNNSAQRMPPRQDDSAMIHFGRRICISQALGKYPVHDCSAAGWAPVSPDFFTHHRVALAADSFHMLQD